VTVRFLADEDLDSGIIEGLRSLEPAIDILDAKEAGLRGTKDPVILELAARQERIVISVAGYFELSSCILSTCGYSFAS
jgi:hypothetical protein